MRTKKCRRRRRRERKWKPMRQAFRTRAHAPVYEFVSVQELDSFQKLLRVPADVVLREAARGRRRRLVNQTGTHDALAHGGHHKSRLKQRR